MERKQRAKMPPSQRAKQFMPFAAVKGLEMAIAEQDQKFNQVSPIELADGEITKIDTIIRSLRKGIKISVCFFDNGQYFNVTGVLEEISGLQQILRIGENRILFQQIKEVDVIQ